MREGEWRPACLGGSAGVGGDVLAGRDTECTWEDVYKGMLHSVNELGMSVRGRRLTCLRTGDETREGADFHSEMEAKLKMNW